MGGGVIPARRSPAFARFFAGYSRRMMRRDFSNVRLVRGSEQHLRNIDTHRGPAIALLNHASWWDPLLGLVLADMFAPSRVLASPIEAAQLEKFRFMRRLGLFGIDPDAPESMELLVEHCVGLFCDEPRTMLGLTPQGEFADVRRPVRIRPGAARVAARLEDPLVVAVACEYTFWNERKPELLIRVAPCDPPPRPTTTGWARVMTRTMNANAEALAGLAIARDGSAFESLLGRGTGIHPVYDLLLRLRGRRPEITPRREGASA